MQNIFSRSRLKSTNDMMMMRQSDLAAATRAAPQGCKAKSDSELSLTKCIVGTQTAEILTFECAKSI